MPSWNIHIAQAERLFARAGSTARLVTDRNAFLFGCLTPDIPVGYMVPGIEHPIAYRITHVAQPAFIPKPREGEFWDTYVAPAAERLGVRVPADGLAGGGCAAAAKDSTGVKGAAAAKDSAGVSGAPAAQGSAATSDPAASPIIPASSLKIEVDRVNRVHYPQRFEGVGAPPRQDSPLDTVTDPASLERSLFDLVLGAWSHLLADNIWNTRVNEYLDAIGGVPSEHFRIKKQGDFDAFGKTLAIQLVPRATPRLLATAAAFPQYAISERAALMTVGVAHEIVRTNKTPTEPNHYRLLTDEFFTRTFAEVIDRTDSLIAERLSR